MDREEAEKMLETLTKFYKEPVMPMRDTAGAVWRGEREVRALLPATGSA